MRWTQACRSNPDDLQHAFRSAQSSPDQPLASLAISCHHLPMTEPMPQPDILAIGAVLWDTIGRSASQMRLGSDVPGRITRLPGGVALNIAATLAKFRLRPALLSAIGRDKDGDDLIEACKLRGLITTHVYRSDDLPTDRYMAIEGANGLVAAVADAHSLEAAGDKILRPLADGSLGSAAAPWAGLVALDGNLTEALLSEIAHSPLFARADLRIAPASPGKAERLRPLVTQPRATLYLNLEEAGILCHQRFADTTEAAVVLLRRGANRVLITDGGRLAADGNAEGILHSQPPLVQVARITGAGDTFMAAHIAAERAGAGRKVALNQALQAAADFVSGEIGS